MKTKYNMEQIAFDLLTMSTDTEVCKKNNISVTTLFRLKNKKEFQDIFIKQKEKIHGELIKKAQLYSLEALNILIEIAKDRNISPSSRVTACTKILEMGQTAFEQEIILKKVEDIERKMKENESQNQL